MAKAGDTFVNPMTGQRVVFLAAAEETGGAYVEVEWFIEPYKGKFPAEHVHPDQTEQFKIISGTACYRLGGVEYPAKAGDVIDFPPRIAHVHPWSTGPEGLHMTQTSRPPVPDVKAIRVAEVLTETGFNLAAEGRVGRDGLPKNPLQTALLAEAALPYSYVTWPPLALQRAALAVLAPLARLLGYRFRYEKYSGPDKEGLF